MKIRGAPAGRDHRCYLARVIGATRSFAVSAAIATLACAVCVAEGCSTGDCAETATCPDLEDGAPSRDASVSTRDASEAMAADGLSSDAEPSEDASVDSPIDVGGDGASDGEATSDGPGGGRDGASLDGCVKSGAHEDCTNGVDDDCNGEIDCADSYCQGLGFGCAPQWPGGGAWEAPVALYDLTVPNGPAPTPPPCVGDYQNDIMDGHDTPVAGAANCACSCGPVQDGGCTTPYVAVWTSAGCGGTIYSAPVAADGTCTIVESAQDGINSGEIVDAGLPSGQCVPTLDASVPAWNPGAAASWAGTGRVCAPNARPYFAGPAGGCGAGTVCVEPAPSTFGAGKICLLSSGQVACPAAYGVQHTYYDGGVDNRGCTDGCSCAAPVGVRCQPTVNLYSDGDCSGTAHPVMTSCTNATSGSLGSNNKVSANATSSASGGECTASAGATAPTGGVSPSTGATTVCCEP
jgi:hypothetical protein